MAPVIVEEVLALIGEEDYVFSLKGGCGQELGVDGSGFRWNWRTWSLKCVRIFLDGLSYNFFASYQAHDCFRQERLQ